MFKIKNTKLFQSYQKLALPLFFKVLIAFVFGLVFGQLVAFFPTLGIFLRVANTFSGLFSNYMSFFVPLLIVGLITPEIIELGSNAKRLLSVTLLIIYCSMAIAGMFAYLAAVAIIPYLVDLTLEYNTQITETFLPTNFKIAPVFGLLSALVLSFSLGLAGSVIKVKTLQPLLCDLRKVIMRILHSFIVPLLPLYIAAVFAKISAEGTLINNLVQYSTLIGTIIVLQIAYLLFINTAAALITKRSLPLVLSRLLSLYLTGLTTQSSTASIPVSLFVSEKLQVSENARNFVTPIAATMHMTGSVIDQTFGAIIIYRIFFGELIDFTTALLMINFLIIVLIATPGVPGGAPAATVPLFKEVLGFGTEASAVMYLVGITNDAFSTATNISADPAIAMFVDQKIKGKDPHNRGSLEKEPLKTKKEQ